MNGLSGTLLQFFWKFFQVPVEPKPKKRTISAAVEILGTEASAEPEDEEGGARPGL